MATRFVSHAALALTMFALASCSSLVEPGDRLADAKARWLQSGPASYTMTVTRGCGECLALSAGSVVVKVVNRQVVSRTYVATGDAVPSSFAGVFPDIEEFFDLISDVLDDNPYKADVEYDSELGYPTALSVDLNKQMVDDEFSITVSDFKPNQ
jgi:hypothetical protein